MYWHAAIKVLFREFEPNYTKSDDSQGNGINRKGHITNEGAC